MPAVMGPAPGGVSYREVAGLIQALGRRRPGPPAAIAIALHECGHSPGIPVTTRVARQTGGWMHRPLSIAAASILAKVTRDRIMRRLAPEYPAYNFEANKGYPCLRHRAALQGYGPSAIHRRSWAFMDNYVPFDGVKVPAERFRQSP